MVMPIDPESRCANIAALALETMQHHKGGREIDIALILTVFALVAVLSLISIAVFAGALHPG